MTTEEDYKQLFQNVIDDPKAYRLSDAEIERFQQAERDVIHEPEYAKSPYKTLVGIVFATLEQKAHMLRQEFLEKISKIPINQLPFVCAKCEVLVKDHGDVCDPEQIKRKELEEGE